MQNLAGVHSHTHKTIIQELTEARITVVEHLTLRKSEVKTFLTGQLTNADNTAVVLTCTREWYYWVVRCDVPLSVAQELYATEVGKRDIRVNGHAGCPPPDQWAFPKYETVKAYCQAHHIDPSFEEVAVLCNSGQLLGDRFVSMYHIDSQEGLNLFIDTLRQHNLVGRRQSALFVDD